jgi:hypothetical protein
MATAAVARPGTVARRLEGRPRTTSREDLVTVVLSFWTTAGVFLDGWAHTNILDGLDSFFTPWHAVFYSGYVASAAWIIYLSQRHRRRGLGLDVSAVPVGYGLGLAAVFTFALGGVGDMIWHTIYGIEAGIEALLSPTHILLFVSGFGIVTSPFRAAWHSEVPRRQPLQSFLPVLASMTVAVASVAFFFLYLSPFTNLAPTLPFVRWAAGVGPAAADLGHASLGLGIAAYLWTTLMLTAPLLLALRRWDLPFGTATIMFTAVALGLSSVEAFEGGAMAASALAGGAVADLLLRWLRPSPDRPAAYRAFGALAAAALWTANFAVIAAVWGLGWSVELWTGTVCLSALAGLALAYLMAPAPWPTEGTAAPSP